MPDETQVAEALRNAIDLYKDNPGHPLCGETDGLPESESGFTLTLVDGTTFLVNVTKIKEGE